MIESILFQPLAFVFLGTSTAAAAALGATVRAAKREDTALLRAVEAGVLTFMGGFLARSFILLLLSLAGDTQQAGLVLGWGFFLWPGLIDTLLIVLKGAPALTTPEALAWIATAVGAFTGMLAGVWGSHRWYGLGWLAFPLDVTWGLAGSTNACLLHLVNFAWAGHADAPADRRRENHRYVAGFAFKSGFAFTQGSVMSNLHLGPGTDLWGHENTHVWQNRLFGPLFTLGYLAWAAMAVLIITGIGNIFEEDDRSFLLDHNWGVILQVKITLVVLTILLTALHSFVIGPRMLAAQESLTDESQIASMRRFSIIISAANGLLALGILFCAALLGTAFAHR